MSNHKEKKSNIPEWMNVRELSKRALQDLAEQQRLQSSVKIPETPYTVTSTYKCPGCKLQFTSGTITAQLKKAARELSSTIECPHCASALIPGKPIMIKASVRKPSIASHTLQPLHQPGRAPNSWVDKANYGRMIDKLGKYVESLGVFNPQIRFQRGVRSSIFPGQSNTAKGAEFTIEFVDAARTRNRFVVQAGLTPNGELITPRTFRTLSGNEYPLTKEAIRDLISGKMYDAVSPKINIKPLVYRPTDPVRFRVISADNKKMVKTAQYQPGVDANIDQKVQEYMQQGMAPEEAAAAAYGDMMQNNQTINPANPAAQQTGFMGGVGTTAYTPVSPSMSSNTKTKKANANQALIDAINQGLTFPEAYADVSQKTGQIITQADWDNTIASLGLGGNPGLESTFAKIIDTAEAQVFEEMKLDMHQAKKASILADYSPIEQDIWATAYMMSYNNVLGKEYNIEKAHKVASIDAQEVLNQYWVKIALRDEKTYVPFADPDPDYSLAEQTKLSEKPFDMPYDETDAGISDEKDRNYTTMFKGKANKLNLKKESKKLAYITEDDGHYTVHAENGRVLGKHPSRDKAEKQLQAIEISKHKKGSIEKTAESTGIDLTPEDRGQNPINYSRYINMIQDLLRSGNIPPAKVDLHALKDHKYTLDELKKLVDTFKTNKNTFYPTPHASIEKREVLAANPLEAESALQKVLEGEVEPSHSPSPMGQPANEGGVVVVIEKNNNSTPEVPGSSSDQMGNPVEDKVTNVIQTVEDLMQSLVQEASVKLADEFGLVDPQGNPISSQPQKQQPTNIDFNITTAQPRAIQPNQSEIPVEAPQAAAGLMEELRAGQDQLGVLAAKAQQLKMSIAQELSPISAEAGKIGIQQQKQANQIVQILNQFGLKLVKAGDQIGFLAQLEPKMAKLSDEQKVKALLSVFGSEAQTVLDEAEKKWNEIRRTNAAVKQYYQQWKQRKSKRANEQTDMYVSSLYQSIYNDIAGLLSKASELEFALAE